MQDLLKIRNIDSNLAPEGGEPRKTKFSPKLIILTTYNKIRWSLIRYEKLSIIRTTLIYVCKSNGLGKLNKLMFIWRKTHIFNGNYNHSLPIYCNTPRVTIRISSNHLVHCKSITASSEGYVNQSK